MSSFYPIYIDLYNKPVLVVGGGTVAYRKVKTLLEYDALVRIVSPQVIPDLKNIIDRKRCVWIEKEYASEDIQDAVLVFSCTEKEEVNAQVAADSKDSCRPANVVDDPDKCTFIVPSVLKRGDLSIAVSTAGNSPIVARQIRQELENIYGDEMQVYLDLLKAWRKEIKKHLPMDKRLQFWEKVTDGQVLSLIKQGQHNQAKEAIEDCFRSLSGYTLI